jgi:hypothetical protein
MRLPTIVHPTGIAALVIAAIEDLLQVEHDVGIAIGQRHANARQGLAQPDRPHFRLPPLAATMQTDQVILMPLQEQFLTRGQDSVFAAS